MGVNNNATPEAQGVIVNTIAVDRMDLAQGCMDATADLRVKSLRDVVEYFAEHGRYATTYWDGYSAVLHQAELVAWDLFISSRPPMAGRPALTHSRSVAA